MIGNIVAAVTSMGEAATDFESIETVTVGAGGATPIEFINIPSTYQHLQIRAIFRAEIAGEVDQGLFIRVNGDSGNNYATHTLRGDGSSAAVANVASSTSRWYPMLIPAGAATASTYGALVMDILDYKDTNKFKTARMLGGYDRNGAGTISFSSGLWMSTSAITSISFLVELGGTDFNQFTQIALYGIRG